MRKKYWCVASEFDGNGIVSARLYSVWRATEPLNKKLKPGGENVFKNWFDSEEEARKYLEDVSGGAVYARCERGLIWRWL